MFPLRQISLNDNIDLNCRQLMWGVRLNALFILTLIAFFTQMLKHSCWNKLTKENFKQLLKPNQPKRIFVECALFWCMLLCGSNRSNYYWNVVWFCCYNRQYWRTMLKMLQGLITCSWWVRLCNVAVMLTSI